MTPPATLSLSAFAGLCAAYYLFPFGGALSAAFVFLGLALILAFLPVRGRRAIFVTAAAALFSMAAGLGWRYAYDALFVEPLTALDAKTLPVTAELLSFSTPTSAGTERFAARLRLPDGRTAKVTLFVNGAPAFLRPGDILETDVLLTAPIPGAPGDKLLTMRPKGLFASASQKGALVTHRPDAVPLALQPVLWSHAVRDALSQSLPPDAAALIRGILLGDTSSLDETTTSALSDAGVSHAVAVSGLHVSFLAGLILLLVGNRRRAFFLCIPIILLFVAVAGFPASAVRASVMLFCVLLGALIGRQGNALTALSVSLFLLTAFNPYAAADVGLQLSFASVLGILLFATRLKTALSGDPEKPAGLPRRLLRILAPGLSISLSALILTTPLTLLYFGTLSLISPLSNLLTLWLVSVCFLGGMLVAFSSFFWAPLSVGFAWILTPFARLFLFLVQSLARLPFAALKSISAYMGFWVVFVYALLLINAVWPLIPGDKRPLGTSLSAAAATLALTLMLSSLRPAALEIDVLDVGQGQSILLLTRDTTMLVDCGGNANHLARTIADRLKSMGRRRIDLLAFTHTHSDHAGTAVSLMDQVDVACLALPAMEINPSEIRTDLLYEAKRRNIPVVQVETTTRYALGPASLLVYPPLGAAGDDENETGLTFLVNLHDFDFLITGDMNEASERALLRSVTLPTVEVLVAGHHGSRFATTESLLEAASPKVAVISVGQNTYGHPTPQTLQRLEDHGVAIYRTDENGTVRIQVG